jgi:hypothetical protein
LTDGPFPPRYNARLLVLGAAFLQRQFNGKQGGDGRFMRRTVPALPPQRSANGWQAFAIPFSITVTGARRWEGLQKDDSPSPDTGQHRGCMPAEPAMRLFSHLPAGKLARVSSLIASNEPEILARVRV